MCGKVILVRIKKCTKFFVLRSTGNAACWCQNETIILRRDGLYTIEFGVNFCSKQIVSNALTESSRFGDTCIFSFLAAVDNHANGILSISWKHFEELEVCQPPSHVGRLTQTPSSSPGKSHKGYECLEEAYQVF